MGAGRKTKTFELNEKVVPAATVNCSISARNLRKNELGGVIFGCKNHTINECFSKQLFGLPATHHQYVNNINPGLPLFLFNYSDRKLHGIFEATSHGGLNINPYGWTVDGTEFTPFPAQVKFQIRMQCEPLVEDQFSPVIAQNYYEPKLFWFELDQDQTNKLISLFSSSPLRSISIKGSHARKLWREGETVKTSHANQANVSMGTSTMVPQKLWRALFKDDVGSDAKEAIGEHNSSVECDTRITESSNVTPVNILRGMAIRSETIASTPLPQEPWSSLYESEAGLDPSEAIREDTTLLQEPWGALHTNKFGSDAREFIAMDNHGDDLEENSIETTNSKLKYEDLSSVVGKLLMELKDLRSLQSEQVQKISYLEQELVESRIEIQQLKERFKVLESVSFPAIGFLDEEEFASSNESLDELILIGGHDGSSWLSSLDSYSLSKDIMKSLSSIRSVRSYASAAKLNSEVYIFGGVKDDLWYNTVESYNLLNNQWTAHPSLNQKKGGLAGVSFDDKIFAIGGGNGIQCFSEVDMLDVHAGRWIPTCSMFHKRFASAAAEINGMVYVLGGYDGMDYLKSIERYDPRESSWTGLESMTTKRAWHSSVVLNGKLYALGGYDGYAMVPTVEVFDPRVGSWMMGESMNNARGYFGAVVMGDTIYVIGGSANDETLDSVEYYREGHGWQLTDLKAIGKRRFFSVVV